MSFSFQVETPDNLLSSKRLGCDSHPKQHDSARSSTDIVMHVNCAVGKWC